MLYLINYYILIKFIGKMIMESPSFDCLVIGAGPAGYVTAIRLSQLGKKVAVIEKSDTLGGTCLNVGCIPSKALLDASYKYHQAAHEFENIGVNCSGIELDVAKMLSHKNRVVSDLTKGIDHLFKKNKITHIQGCAHFKDQKTVEVIGGDGKIQTFSAPTIIIAVGSVPQTLETIPLNDIDIVNSTGALEFKQVPRHLVVIGGGYIGLELGSVWCRLGAKVTVVEYADTILGQMDDDVRQILKTSLEKMGMVFKLGHSVVGVMPHAKTEKDAESGHIRLHVKPKNEKEDANIPDLITCDAVLVAAGRKPATASLKLEAAGIAVDQRNVIQVNDRFETSVSGIYAIGDCVRGPMLAHKAMDEGVALAEMLCGQAGFVNYNIIPAVIFTHPEVATVGMTEQDLKSKNKTYKIGKFPYSANGRARTVSETNGFVKILTDDVTGRVLGCAIIGAEAGSLIAQVAAIMEFGGTAEDIARTCHAHPTLNEVIREAAWASFAKPLHS